MSPSEYIYGSTVNLTNIVIVTGAECHVLAETVWSISADTDFELSFWCACTVLWCYQTADSNFSIAATWVTCLITSTS